MTGYTFMTVCTGNICRSPLAEQLFESRLGAPYRFLSSGLHAVPGAPMDSLSAAESKKLGGTPQGISTQISEDLVAQSDLILTMTQAQRDSVASRFPSALKKSYSIGEFAKIVTTFPNALQVEHTDPFAPASPFINAARFRGAITLITDDDVPDPIGQDPSVHARVAQQISRYIDQIVGVLIGTERTT